jgi:hypothetical protein
MHVADRGVVILLQQAKMMMEPMVVLDMVEEAEDVPMDMGQLVLPMVRGVQEMCPMEDKMDPMASSRVSEQPTYQEERVE